MKTPGRNDAAAALRARLAGQKGRAFWRSLDELADTPDFRAFLEAEFPSLAPTHNGIDRRSMLKVMAASLALAGLSGCSSQPDETALPYVNAPESLILDKPKWYATAVTFAGYGQPVLGKTINGRPIKLEGNPDHPALRGATDLFMQAAILGLYDPDRSQAPRHLGRASTWNAADTALWEMANAISQTQGEGFRLLTGAVSSPTLLRQIDELLKRWPKAHWHVFEPVNQDARHDAAQMVFGQPLAQHTHLDAAEVIVSLDDDLLGPGPRQAVAGRQWSMRRQAMQKGDGESRLFAAEPIPSATGAVAEDRLIVAHSRISLVARALAGRLGLPQGGSADLSDGEKRWLDQATAAVNAHHGRALVTVGDHHAAELHALALLINEHIGSFGQTLTFSEPILASPPDGARSFDILAADMAAGRVTTLMMIGVNPVYAAPAGLHFAEALGKVALRLHAGTHYDETAALSHWHLPLPHDLESWSDCRAVDGTVSIIQPLVRPFYAVRSAHALLSGLIDGGGTPRDLVQATWRAAWGDAFDKRWQEALQRGFVADSAPQAMTPTIASRDIAIASAAAASGLAVVLRADPTIWDGRFAGNAWLQETPKPLTKITWDNAIFISPQLAAERAIGNGDELRLEAGGAVVTGAAWIVPGQEPDTIGLTLGYGRERAGDVGTGLGVNAFSLQQRTGQWYLAGASLNATGERRKIASTQLHQAMNGFDFVRIVGRENQDVSKQRGAPGPEATQQGEAPSFYPARKWDSPSWGMSIDLDLCIGCNACVVACVAENNIPMVGKDLVAQGRQMHWLRVDHYYEGEPAAPKSYFQPVPCMHCEQAPCEMGCPVNAAVHSSDGLNLQVYNRCIGTRTCSSYCPYKVRRFNWFDYTGNDPEQLQAMRNPDVTVRARGVMEKCTYCVQRIAEARIAAKEEGRPIRDGEVVTACQQACPTQAIVFGDVVDANSHVSQRKASPRDYALLEEVNTRPRTTYLARIGHDGSGEGGAS